MKNLFNNAELWYTLSIMKISSLLNLALFTAGFAFASSNVVDTVKTESTKPVVSTNAPSPYCNFYGKDVKTVGIVSLSSILERQFLKRGIRRLKEAGYKVKVSPNVYGPERAPVEVRARAFEEAWLDPEIDILVLSRGGQGAVDAIQAIDWEKLRVRNDMRVIGFSDVTFVVNTMLTKGVGHPLSGPMLSSIGGTGLTKSTIEWLRKTYDGDELPVKKLKVVKAPEKTISGLGMAGLLERFVRLEEMGLLPDMTGRIVFIESLNTHSKFAREKLTILQNKGVFDKAAAVVFGDFRVAEGSKTTIAEFAKAVKCPVFSGFSYGHIRENLAIDFRREYFISPKGILSSPACK